MATLTPADYGALREAIYRPGAGKEELKSLPALPNKDALLAAFQSMEDRFEKAFGDLQAGLGGEFKGAEGLAAKMLAAFLRRKIETMGA